MSQPIWLEALPACAPLAVILNGVVFLSSTAALRSRGLPRAWAA